MANGYTFQFADQEWEALRLKARQTKTKMQELLKQFLIGYAEDTSAYSEPFIDTRDLPEITEKELAIDPGLAARMVLDEVIGSKQYPIDYLRKRFLNYMHLHWGYMDGEFSSGNSGDGEDEEVIQWHRCKTRATAVRSASNSAQETYAIAFRHFLAAEDKAAFFRKDLEPHQGKETSGVRACLFFKELEELETYRREETPFKKGEFREHIVQYYERTVLFPPDDKEDDSGSVASSNEEATGPKRDYAVCSKAELEFFQQRAKELNLSRGEMGQLRVEWVQEASEDPENFIKPLPESVLAEERKSKGFFPLQPAAEAIGVLAEAAPEVSRREIYTRAIFWAAVKHGYQYPGMPEEETTEEETVTNQPDTQKPPLEETGSPQAPEEETAPQPPTPEPTEVPQPEPTLEETPAPPPAPEFPENDTPETPTLSEEKSMEKYPNGIGIYAGEDFLDDLAQGCGLALLKKDKKFHPVVGEIISIQDDEEKFAEFARSVLFEINGFPENTIPEEEIVPVSVLQQNDTVFKEEFFEGVGERIVKIMVWDDLTYITFLKEYLNLKESKTSLDRVQKMAYIFRFAFDQYLTPPTKS